MYCMLQPTDPVLLKLYLLQVLFEKEAAIIAMAPILAIVVYRQGKYMIIL
mgnify:CR=1 FL=1